MGERYRTSSGGLSGNALDYLDAQFQYEWERDYQEYRKGHWGVSEESERLLKVEADFYRNMPLTKAMDAAIAALEREKQRQKEK